MQLTGAGASPAQAHLLKMQLDTVALATLWIWSPPDEALALLAVKLLRSAASVPKAFRKAAPPLGAELCLKSLSVSVPLHCCCTRAAGRVSPPARPGHSPSHSSGLVGAPAAGACLCMTWTGARWPLSLVH